jgi:hypothetical protein
MASDFPQGTVERRESLKPEESWQSLVELGKEYMLVVCPLLMKSDACSISIKT